MRLCESFKLSFLIGCTILLAACSSRQPKADAPAADPAFAPHAELLAVAPSAEAAYFEVFMPGDSVPLASYTLIPDSSQCAAVEGSAALRSPLRRVVVFSSIHAGAMRSIGAAGAIVGVADASYYAPDDTVAALVKSGRVADVGSSLAPDVERIISLNPDAVLLSPSEAEVPSALLRSGIPIVYLSDYLETDPVGRAEWLRLFGLMFGREAAADSLTAEVARAYGAIAAKIAESASAAPKVFTEIPYSGYWYVPGGASYAARLLSDAGADYPWAADSVSGSIPLDVAAVIGRAADADFWLIKNAGDLSAAQLRAAVPHAGAFKAWPDGVYVTNTLETDFYYLLAFRPDLVLADYACIFHPELFDGLAPEYFKPLSR